MASNVISYDSVKHRHIMRVIETNHISVSSGKRPLSTSNVMNIL